MTGARFTCRSDEDRAHGLRQRKGADHPLGLLRQVVDHALHLFQSRSDPLDGPEPGRCTSALNARERQIQRSTELLAASTSEGGGEQNVRALRHAPSAEARAATVTSDCVTVSLRDWTPRVDRRLRPKRDEREDLRSVPASSPLRLLRRGGAAQEPRGPHSPARHVSTGVVALPEDGDRRPPGAESGRSIPSAASDSTCSGATSSSSNDSKSCVAQVGSPEPGPPASSPGSYGSRLRNRWIS